MQAARKRTGYLVEGDLRLSHTFVKHKSPYPEFSAAAVWVGDPSAEQERVGGSQKVDGFFAAFRRVVGKRSFITGHVLTNEWRNRSRKCSVSHVLGMECPAARRQVGRLNQNSTM